MCLNFNAPKGFTKVTIDDALVKPCAFYLKAYIVYFYNMIGNCMNVI